MDFLKFYYCTFFFFFFKKVFWQETANGKRHTPATVNFMFQNHFFRDGVGQRYFGLKPLVLRPAALLTASVGARFVFFFALHFFFVEEPA